MVLAGDIVAEAQSTDTFLEQMRTQHKRRLRKAIRDLEDKMVNQLAHLDVTKGGKLEGIKINLKQSQKIHASMTRIFEEDYGQAVGRIVGEYGQIASQIKRSWRHLGESVHFTDIDKAMLTSLQSQSYGQFAAFGEAAQSRMADAMYSSVVAGASYAQLVKTVQGILRGHVDVRGRPMTAYADTHAFDAVMNFHNDVNLKKSEDLGIKKFMYVGDIMTTTRPFCRKRVGNFYTRAQIERWNTLNWSGKSGPPLTHRGGYNCRHHWRGIKDDWLDEEEFGKVTDDELFAMSKSKDFPEIDEAITMKEGLKRKYEASMVTSKALKKERGILKGGTATPTSVSRLKDISKTLTVEKDIRRDLKRGVVSLKEDVRKQGKKLKKDIHIGRDLEALGKAELHPPSPPKKISGPVLEKTGISSISDSGPKKYTDFQREILAPIKKETDRMLDYGDGSLRKLVTKDKLLGIEAYNSVSLPGVEGRLAVHSLGSAGSKIRIGSIRSKMCEPEYGLKLGGWQVSDAVIGTYRHEFGHHVHKVLLSAEDRIAWVKLWRENPEEWYWLRLSNYASTNVKEAFAEAYSAFLHPKYKRGMLQREVEEYFDKLFNTGDVKLEKLLRRKKTFQALNIPSAWTKKVQGEHNKTAKIWAKFRGISVTDYVKKMNKNIQKIADKSDVYIRITPGNFRSVLYDGRFKTQFETQQSGGLLANHQRAQFEKKFMGYGPKTSDLKRPIYGYLSDDVKGPRAIGQYGNVSIKLKDSVRKRTTFTIGDSLDRTACGRWPTFQPSPVNKVSNLCDFTFEATEKEFRRGWEKDALSYKSSAKPINVGYWEAQIHDGVEVSDIEEVFFSSNPGADMKKRLKDLDIKWSVGI